VRDLFESEKEGLLVRLGDVQGLANAMTSLLINREARQSMGTAAKRRARESFDVSTMIQAYEELYEHLVHYFHSVNKSTLSESAIPAEGGREEAI
jgi:glycosyltransferase involved in cell wall biosynthesis